MCGEHIKISSTARAKPGSSPHVRGTRRAARPADPQEGIIPACAGNTWWRQPSRWKPRDHPRMCGEHSILNAAANASTGSSPHVRGTPVAPDAPLRAAGIIPACAGNTSPQPAIPQFSRDHPRMCGEHRLRRVC